MIGIVIDKIKSLTKDVTLFSTFFVSDKHYYFSILLNVNNVSHVSWADLRRNAYYFDKSQVLKNDIP